MLPSPAVLAPALSSSLEPLSVTLPGGVRLEYVEQGEPSGVPVVFLHGTSDSWRSFAPVLPHLPPSIRALAVSLRGHGGSSRPPAGYRYADFAKDIAAFLDAVGVRTAVVVGHSMGSLIAQRVAIDHPERTAGLVLIGSGPTIRGNAGVEELWTSGVSGMTDPVDPAFVTAFQASTVARPVAGGLIDAAVAESLRVPARIWREMFIAMRRDDHTSELSRITAPTLLVWSDRDALFLREDQTRLLAAIPHARLVVETGGGHAVHWETPAHVASLIADFVRRAVCGGRGGVAGGSTEVARWAPV